MTAILRYVGNPLPTEWLFGLSKDRDARVSSVDVKLGGGDRKLVSGAHICRRVDDEKSDEMRRRFSYFLVERLADEAPRHRWCPHTPVDGGTFVGDSRSEDDSSVDEIGTGGVALQSRICEETLWN